jgi:transcriptional regulator with XRE-family HTH domain
MTQLDALEAKITARRDLPPPQLRRLLREDLGLSQEDVAQAVGVHRETVSRWERGLCYPRGRHLVDYATLLARLRTGAAA